MGNHLNPSPSFSTFLLDPINPSLESLTNWKKKTIISFHHTYLSMYPLSIYLSSSEFSRLLSLFLAPTDTKEIFIHFKHPLTNTINILEVLSCLITFSNSDLEDKVSMSFKIFDFDHSNKLNQEEFKILCRSFFKGLKQGTLSANLVDFSTLIPDDKLISTFSVPIECKSEHEITQQEYFLFRLENFVKTSKVLTHLLKRKQHPRYSQNRASLAMNVECSKDKNTQSSKTRRKSSLVSNLELPSLISSSPALKDYKEIFQSCCTRTQKAQVFILYNKMIKFKKFSRYANEFYMNYHFKLNTELNLNEFLGFFRNFTGKPFERAYRVAQHRRAGFSMDVPKGEIKKIIEEKEEKNKKTKRALIKLFNDYDENKDGGVDLKELKNHMNAYATNKGIEEVFDEFDVDKNKTLDFEEFFHMFEPGSRTFDGRRRKKTQKSEKND
jgi:Ca2+-binding EF-hand superfamily protein